MSSNGQSNNKDFVKKLKIYALATDPIYIGTGGYNIGRVDNTIVRDPTTNLPKIPGSSLAGVWRYYVVLEALKRIEEKISSNLNNILKQLNLLNDEELGDNNNNKFLRLTGFNELRNSICEILEVEEYEERKEISKKLADILEEKIFSNNSNNSKWWLFSENRFLQITCAGQDNVPQKELEEAPYAESKEGKTGHCGHCIVCKGFGFSKKDISWQGMLFFSDLQILFFPVFTIKGTKWITTASKLKEIGIKVDKPSKNKIKTKQGNEEYLNLGWLYLEVEGQHGIGDNTLNGFNFENFQLTAEDVIIVPEELFSNIVNSNLEVRTSVSIDPITGAAKEGALFTSEAIPRGTIFYGEIRIFDKSGFAELEPKLKPLPRLEDLENALKDSSHYFESLGIGGMTTRGFGRLKIKREGSQSGG